VKRPGRHDADGSPSVRVIRPFFHPDGASGPRHAPSGDYGRGIGQRERVRPAAVTAIVAAAVFVALAVAVGHRWGPLVHFDQRFDDRLNGHVSAHPAEASFWRGVSAVLSPAVVRTALLVVAAGLLYRRRIRPAILCAGASLGSIALVSGVKGGVGRLRPVVHSPVASAPGASFPSGHATASATAALTLIVLLWPVLRGWLRWIVTAVAGLLAAAVGFSRLALGVHFPSDVVGGWAGATALVFGLVAVLRVRRDGAAVPGKVS
jgi:undecaprenyl-diphosphatase